MEPSSGIDARSSLEDIRHAFWNQGLRLSVTPERDRWVAIVDSHGIPGVRHEGSDELAAARAAWESHVERNDGTGES